MSYNKKQCGTVVMNPLVPIVGVICELFFDILLIAALHTGAGMDLCILMGIFCLLSLLMILTVNQRIEYTPEGFAYRDMFRLTHTYSYAQVRRIRYSKDVTIQVGHRIILIDQMASNGKKFARIAMQYSRDARIITDSQSRLFGGNIKNPGEFIFAYVLIAMMPVGMAVWGTWYFRDVHLETLASCTGTVSSYSFDRIEKDDERIAIVFEGLDRTFITWQLDDGTPVYAAFQKDAADGRVFEVYYPDTGGDPDTAAVICQLSCGDTVYISLADTNARRRETRTAILAVSAGILFLWLLYVAVSSYVMCNARKYPRLIRFFVKPGYCPNRNGRTVCSDSAHHETMER